MVDTRLSSKGISHSFSSRPLTSRVAVSCEGTEMVMPGDNVNLEVELIAPIAMEEVSALRFAKAAGQSALVS